MKSVLEMLLAVCLLPVVSSPQSKPRGLTEMSLEQLMSTEVTSVSKRAESLFETAAAIYVITGEDIARSGMTSVPELLRMVPGVEVARITNNTWAISARGFNSKFANKMLVLVDGRNVYNQMYSGVFWDVQDLILEDIERIEVIRGPGGSVWGANAVNGVINIITKKAQDTQGGLLTATTGNEERATGGIRYGGRVGSNAYYRIYAKSFDRASFKDATGQDAGDAWHALRGGFRLDWSITPRDELTVQGDLYDGREGRTSVFPTLDPPYQRLVRRNSPVNGGNLFGRWAHTFSPRSDMALHVYLDDSVRYDAELRWDEDTIDVDFQHHLTLGRRHDFIWGFGYRSISTATRGSFVWSLNPVERHDNLLNTFVQDEFVLAPNRLRMTVGTKLEHNDYTGFELEPSVRLLWTPSQRQTFWAAFSRAVRTPSRGESDLRVNSAVLPGPDGMLLVPALIGNSALQSEKVRAYEIGYRVKAGKRVFLDLATYLNSYRDLRREEVRTPFVEAVPTPVHLVVPFQFVNSGREKTYGLELAATWNPNTAWKVRAAYTFLEEQVRSAWNPALISEGTLTDSPKHQGQVGSSLRLARRWEWNSAMYYVSPLNVQGVRAYVRLDTGLQWAWTERLEIGAGVQNLLRPWHREFAPAEFLAPSQVPRNVWGRVTWRF